MTTQKCSVEVNSPNSGWSSWHPCRNKAKVERDGKWFCGVHDPAKDDHKRERWDLERVESSARYAIKEAEQYAIDELTAAYPDHPAIRRVLDARQALVDARAALAAHNAQRPTHRKPANA